MRNRSTTINLCGLVFSLLAGFLLTPLLPLSIFAQETGQPIKQVAKEKGESNKTVQETTTAASNAKIGDHKSQPLSVNEDPSQIGTRNINKGFVGWLGGSKEKEAALGRQLAAEVEQQSKILADSLVNEYVNRVGQNIALHSDVKVPVPVGEAASIVADGEFLNITTHKNRVFVINFRLKDLEARLDRAKFVRLSRGIFGDTSATPLKPGYRNQFNVGVQQAFGKYVVADVDYFDKRTRNAYDFNVILNTPITFPISWDRSHINGISFKVNLTNYKGLSAFYTGGHTRALFFPPESGGLFFNSDLPAGPFLIDHDQKFQQTAQIQYGFDRFKTIHKFAPYVAFTYRYDSGLVSGAVPDYTTALGFSANEQQQIGLFCGSQTATIKIRRAARRATCST